jgi:hypothetical protein
MPAIAQFTPENFTLHVRHLSVTFKTPGEPQSAAIFHQQCETGVKGVPVVPFAHAGATAPRITTRLAPASSCRICARRRARSTRTQTRVSVRPDRAAPGYRFHAQPQRTEFAPTRANNRPSPDSIFKSQPLGRQTDEGMQRSPKRNGTVTTQEHIVNNRSKVKRKGSAAATQIVMAGQGTLTASPTAAWPTSRDVRSCGSASRVPMRAKPLPHPGQAAA